VAAREPNLAQFPGTGRQAIHVACAANRRSRIEGAKGRTEANEDGFSREWRWRCVPPDIPEFDESQQRIHDCTHAELKICKPVGLQMSNERMQSDLAFERYQGWQKPSKYRR
jgi:hypothetical protein